MNFLLVLVCVLLIGLILFLLARLFLLLKKGKSEISDLKYYAFNAWLLLAFLVGSFSLLLWYIAGFKGPWLPFLASVHGKHVDAMFWTTMGITGFVFICTHILLFSFAFRYRATASSGSCYHKNNATLEMLWTIIPLITFLILFYFAHQAWTRIKTEPRESLNIEVLGEQFNWRLRYAGKDTHIGSYSFLLMDEQNDFGINLKDTSSYDDFSPVQLHLPKGVPVRLHIRSRDVIHSVFLPNFRLKMDAVPGMPTSFDFTASMTTEEMREKTGNPHFNYELACAELCGRMHFAMLLIVVVEEQGKFNKWFGQQKSWLASHPEYLSKVPLPLQELAKRKSGLSYQMAHSSY